MILIVIGALGMDLGRVGNEWMNQVHSDYNIVEVSYNTEKSPGELRRLAVTQSPVKDYQLVWKSHKEYHNNNNNTKW